MVIFVAFNIRRTFVWELRARRDFVRECYVFEFFIKNRGKLEIE